MTVSITHAYTATGTNDPTKEVSSTRWNEAHTVTGLGTAAEANATDFATAAQGAKADTALQPADLVLLDPRDFGVVMDASTDQSAAMQDCLDYAEANGHPTIVIPTGRIQLEAQLTYDGPLTMVGVSMRRSRLTWTSGASTRGIDVNLSSTIGLRHTCSISNLSLLTAGSAVGYALDISDSTPADRINPSVVIRDVLIAGSTNPSSNGWARAINMDACQGAYLDGVNIWGKVGSGGEPDYDSEYGVYYANGSTASPHPTELQISNSVIKTVQVAVHADDMEGLIFSASQIVGVNTGVEAVGLADYPHVAISDSHINASEECVVIDRMFEAIVSSNLFYNQNSTATAKGIEIKNAAGFFSIVGNIYENYNTAQAGIGVDVVDGDNGIIDANIFRRCDSIDTTQPGTGIKLQASSSGIKVGNANLFSLTNTNVNDAGSSNIVQPFGALQPLDGDLTTIANLSPSDDDFLQRKSGAWTNRTVAQVQTDLAVQKAIVPGYYPNRYHTGENVGTTSATLAMTANRLYASLFVCGKTTTWTRIGVDVTTLAGGTSIRLGIFSAGTDGAPGTLLLDAGTVTGASTGVQEATISYAMSPGYYYLVAVSDGTPTVRAWAVNINNPTMNMLIGVAVPGTHDAAIYKSFTYAALSGASPFGTPTFTTANTPMVMLRIV